MRHRTNGGTEFDPEAYPDDLEARLERAGLWAAKGLPQEPFERATGDVNRKEAI